jgi:hypothetical protein
MSNSTESVAMKSCYGIYDEFQEEPVEEIDPYTIGCDRWEWQDNR